MAKTKIDLIKEGKEIGLNLTSKMSVYELTHRIKERKEELAKEGKTAPKEGTKSSKKISGEY